jgi:hypothetical protein
MRHKKSLEIGGFTAIREYFYDVLLREECETETSAFRAVSRVEVSHKRDVLVEHFVDFSRSVGKIAETCLKEFFLLKAKTSGTRASIHWAEERVRNLLCDFDPQTSQRGPSVDRWVRTACDGDPEIEYKDQVLRSDWRAPRWTLSNPDGLYPEGTAQNTRLSKSETEKLLNKLFRVLSVTIDRELKGARSLLIVRGGSGKPWPKRRLVRPRTRDQRKDEIAKLKIQQPDLTTLNICREMDRRADRNIKLLPPQTWQTKTGKRLWAELYKHELTKNQVSVYISRISPKE